MASPMVQVNVRIEPDLHARLTRRSKADKQTVTAVVAQALNAYLAPNYHGKTNNGETTK